MKTVYQVAARYFDRFAGLPMIPGYSIVASETARSVRFLNAAGSDLTNELLPPTDEDFAYVRGELDKLVAEGTLTVQTKTKPAPKPVEPPKDADPPAPPKPVEQPKSESKPEPTKKPAKP